MPLGASSPTRDDRSTPAATSLAATARLARSSSAWVTEACSVTTARSPPSSDLLRASSAGIVAGRGGSGTAEQVFQRLRVELAAGEHRHVGVAEEQVAPRHLVGRQVLAQHHAQLVASGRAAVGRHPHGGGPDPYRKTVV